MHDLRSSLPTSLERVADVGGPGLLLLLDVLNPPGEETRIVGGAVRNALLGLRPGDIDLATTMLPQETVRRAKAAGLRSIPTGIAHGTITVLCEGQPFEVTTLREDVETDGRHAVVRFGRDFARDAERRDFTMNALSLGPDGTVHDTVGGLDDLQHGRVRFIGDAATRIREDFLRIMRFFRFHATYGAGAPDPDGMAAATTNRHGLQHLSRERIRGEMLKLLAAPGAAEVLRAMASAGILEIVVPGPVHVDRLATLIAQGEADPMLCLAALTDPDNGRIERLRDALRLTNAEMKRVSAMVEAGPAVGALPAHPSTIDLTRLLFRFGRQAAIDALRLRHAAAPDSFEHALSVLAEAVVPASPVGSADFMARGLKGPALGSALARFRQLWADAGFPLDRAAVETLVARAVSNPAGWAPRS